MRILALALADETKRHIPGYPPRGARLFLRPDLEISRLAEAIAPDDRLVYRDQRVEELSWDGDIDVCLVRVDFGQEVPARELLPKLQQQGIPVLAFGPFVTASPNGTAPWARHRVEGDILNAWTEIRTDADRGSLKAWYRAAPGPGYQPAHGDFGRWPGMNTSCQTTSFIRACRCPDTVRRFCPEYLYHGTSEHRRNLDEIVGEIVSFPRKHIRLLDEDVTSDLDYYHDVFRNLWNYHRHWTVTAGDRIFRHPDLVRLLAKAGTRIIWLNESFLDPRLVAATTDDRLVKQLYRSVKMLQSRRMLVGARFSLRVDPAEPGKSSRDYGGIASVLNHIDLDFIEPRFFARDPDGNWHIWPAVHQGVQSPRDPSWLKASFHSLNRIASKLARRPRRTGFYTTLTYLLPHSLAYRQNFLEGISTP